jgi:hypothetical protein
MHEDNKYQKLPVPELPQREVGSAAEEGDAFSLKMQVVRR